MVKWLWVDFSGFSYFGAWGPLRSRSVAHACVGGVGMRKAVGGAVGASDGLGLFSVLDNLAASQSLSRSETLRRALMRTTA